MEERNGDNLELGCHFGDSCMKFKKKAMNSTKVDFGTFEVFLLVRFWNF